MGATLLEVDNLTTSFFTHQGEVQAVRGVNFRVNAGEMVGIVGESGSGKSVTLLSVLQLLKSPGKTIAGRALFKGENLLDKNERQMRALRGDCLSMIFQDPMTSLNPTLTIGEQIMETLRVHRRISRKAARHRAVELLELVRIPSPDQRLNAYPHEFSGGMRQRVMIAMALSCDPDLLIADEPSTALDVTIQAQIILLLKQIQRELNTAVILITHDLGVIAEAVSRVIVMYGGMIMEEASVEDIFYRPRHPYTWGLLASVPRVDVEEKQRLSPIAGSPPDMLNPPAGCPFFPRCRFALQICRLKIPAYFSSAPGRRSLCWRLHPGAPDRNRFLERQKNYVN
ncbi:MAG: ABC transporter ATP-binding protein [Desulfobacteraceae bacterium]|nr:ABC transporter ATP-binding protein [Desulfobacteraceae bacterium]